jgi:hypothetical protein
VNDRSDLVDLIEPGLSAARTIENQAKMMRRPIEPLLERAVGKDLPGNARRLTKEPANLVGLLTGAEDIRRGNRRGIRPDQQHLWQGKAASSQEKQSQERAKTAGGEHGVILISVGAIVKSRPTDLVVVDGKRLSCRRRRQDAARMRNNP